jgi:hypothetical protein
VDDATQKVNVLDGQPEALALPQPESGHHGHDRRVAVRQRVGHSGDPLDRPGHHPAAVGAGGRTDPARHGLRPITPSSTAAWRMAERLATITRT